MATRTQPSRAAGGNPVPEPSQQNPPQSPPGRARSPEGPPPPPDRIALLEGQVQRLTELLMGFLDRQHQQAQHSRAKERHEPPREEESYRRDENPQRPGQDDGHGEAAESFDLSFVQQRQERRLRQLEEEMAALKPKTGEAQGPRINQPLSLEIMAAIPPERLRISAIKPYAGTSDPMDHLDLFTSHMMVQDASDVMWCRVFLSTLERHAWAWYSNLAHHSIVSFAQLRGSFLAHFAPLRRHRRSTMALVSMKQNQGEPLKDFVSRFNMEALSIENFDHSVAMVAFQNALRPGPFAQSLAKMPPKILATIEGKNYLKKPRPMKAPSDKRNRSKYCRFHRDHGHDTEECHQLKEEIQELINRGFLRSYVAKEGDSRGRNDRRSRSRSPPKRDRTEDRNRAQRERSHRGENDHPQPSIFHTLAAGEVPVMKDEKSSDVRLKRSRSVDPISFSDSDLPGYPTRNDPLVITAELGKWELRRILVDLGSSSEILYRQAFLGMGYEMTQLRAARVPLVGFDGEVVYSEGIIQLPLTVGKGSRTSRVMLDILVADVPSAYNMILGRSGLNALRAIPSTYHMMMKFPTDRGTGGVRGDLRLARECYMASIGITKGKEAGSQKDADPPKEVSFLLEGLEDPKTAEPVDELEEVPLEKDCPS
ncbi:uncharacterized protein LOC127791727 [Diospyros lotus]|uniref:uncharacterized protein LOC127791727 n=1 Tax=Diospyros lotus TaxID=55363 RepID=UPI00224E6B75|nr:uncharacterized protein LOC127791727 [Diospyros lotus]